MATPNPRDVRVTGAKLYFLPVETRVPLKFGPETLTSVTCARVEMTVADSTGRTATGWGETPLSVQWVWPSALPYSDRHEALKRFCVTLARAWSEFELSGHPIEIGHTFIEQELTRLWGVHQLKSVEQTPTHPHTHTSTHPLPWLATLVCCSPFDLALHDAYGHLHGVPTYETYRPPFLNTDLAEFLEPAADSAITFTGRYPAEFLISPHPNRLPAWHLVGGLDALTPDDLTGDEPDDGYPVALTDWISRDGLNCLKVKLRGTDSAWDYDRIVCVGRIAIAQDVAWLSVDFNCTVTEPSYVNDILDRLRTDEPRISDMILYVEQPFPYDLEAYPIDVRSVSGRKPLFMDESAHDWRLIRLGRERGWTGVALKTCKTQTGAILSLCWAKAHDMPLMVQDLSNPMLAQIPHALLAAHAGTIMGVETNSMQFYPDASRPEAAIHPGLYTRRDGHIDLSTLQGPGFGYRVNEIQRNLSTPVF